MSHRSLVVLAAAVAAALVSASPASAASSYQCEASALRGQVLTAPAIEPITANKGTRVLPRAEGRARVGAAAPLGVSALFAETGLTGASGDGARRRSPRATGGVADLRLGPAIDLGANLPVEQALADLPALHRAGPLGTFDLKPAVLAALQPSAEVLRVQVAVAYASARCTNGALALSGLVEAARASSSRAWTCRPTGRRRRTVQVVGGGCDRSLAARSRCSSRPASTRALVTTALNALPTIPVPPSLGRLRITPNQEIRTATSVTERALQVQLELGGQSIVDLVLGEAIVAQQRDPVRSAATPPPPRWRARRGAWCWPTSSPAAAVCGCSGSPDPKLIGKRVTIRFTATASGSHGRACAGTGRSGPRRRCRTGGCAPPTAPATSRSTARRSRCG